jgi:hypothetical protein
MDVMSVGWAAPVRLHPGEVPGYLSSDRLSDFNDGCKDFDELRALILQARATAMNDADAAAVSGRGLDVEADEFVMALKGDAAAAIKVQHESHQEQNRFSTIHLSGRSWHQRKREFLAIAPRPLWDSATIGTARGPGRG